MTESERLEAKKSMAFDLCMILDDSEEGKTYTAEDVEELIKAYIKGLEAK